MPVEITIPFALDARGRVATVSDANAQVRQHVMSLINTEPGERLMFGDYGVPLSDMLFEDADESVADDMRDLLANALATWESGVMIQGVRAREVAGREGMIEAYVGYSRVDAPDSEFSPRNSNTVTISGGRVNEVIRS